MTETEKMVREVNQLLRLLGDEKIGVPNPDRSTSELDYLRAVKREYTRRLLKRIPVGRTPKSEALIKDMFLDALRSREDELTAGRVKKFFRNVLGIFHSPTLQFTEVPNAQEQISVEALRKVCILYEGDIYELAQLLLKINDARDKETNTISRDTVNGLAAVYRTLADIELDRILGVLEKHGLPLGATVEHANDSHSQNRSGKKKKYG